MHRLNLDVGLSSGSYRKSAGDILAQDQCSCRNCWFFRTGISDMFQYFSTILCVHFRNSTEGKSTPRVGNPCGPHPLNKSLLMRTLIHLLHIYCPPGRNWLCALQPPSLHWSCSGGRSAQRPQTSGSEHGKCATATGFDPGRVGSHQFPSYYSDC